MRGPEGTYGFWNYIPQDSEYAQKLAEHQKTGIEPPFISPFGGSSAVPVVPKSRTNSRRFSGRLRFKKKANKLSDGSQHLSKNLELDENENVVHERVSCGRQFREYCASTSLHGYRYIAEPNRTIAERIFWFCWCVFGIISTVYLSYQILSKWAENPVLTSVATTNYPVTNVIFPAVTICTVNKAVTEKLIIQGCRYNYTLSQMRTLISILVDPNARNNDHFNAEQITGIKPATVLKYLRLVAPKCDDYLLTCRWNSQALPCKHIFRLTLTDSGYCCTFNAIETKKTRKDA